MGETIPSQIGQYRISRELGRGGMGVVYLATDQRLDREVAIKVLPSDLAANPERVTRLMREAKILAALNHPNVLTVHDVGSEGETTYLVTERLEGGTLRDRLESAPLSWRKSVEVATAIARGLAAGHEKGIVHRDLKPENVFLTTNGVVKILDFGLARHAGEDDGTGQTQMPTVTHATRAGAVMGTVGYMSPEQVRGEPADARSDIFALGCVLHEMLSGERAFARGSSAESMAAILKEAPSSFEPGTGVPLELERIIMRCLEKEPNERFQSARDLAFALQSTLDERSSTSSHAAVRIDAPSDSRWPIGAMTTIVCAAAILAGMVFWSPWSGPTVNADRINTLVVLPFSTRSEDPDSAFLGEGIAENLINRFARIDEVRVIPRATAFRYAGRESELGTIARELGVRAVVTGRITRRNDRYIVSAELTDTRANAQLWGNRYERDEVDLIDLEKSITDEISSALGLTLGDETSHAGTTNTEAHIAHMEARFWMAKRSPEGFRRALELCDRATSLDPTYALPFALRSQVYMLMAIYTSLSSDVIPLSRQAAERAIELDPGSIDARNTLALIRAKFDWDFKGAEEDFKSIIKTEPRNPTVHHWYGVSLLGVQRFEEATHEIDIARSLDPGSLVIIRETVATMLWEGKNDNAIEAGLRAIELAPDFMMTRVILGWAYIDSGQHEKGIEQLEIALASESLSMRYQGDLAVALGIAGEYTRAREELVRLKALSQTQYVFPSVFAFIHASLGELDECFEWLNRAVDERDIFLTFIRTTPPGLDAMRADPRYQEILDRIGLWPDR